MYRYNETIKILINKFQELEKIYVENIDDYEGLPYVFYESVFVKYILDKVNSNDDDVLKEIFSFVEDMFVKIVLNSIIYSGHTVSANVTFLFNKKIPDKPIQRQVGFLFYTERRYGRCFCRGFVRPYRQGGTDGSEQTDGGGACPAAKNCASVY